MANLLITAADDTGLSDVASPHGSGLSRRALLLAAVGAAMPQAGWLAALASRVQPGLLRSYEDLGTTPFDRAHENCAYVYDNSAAGLALLAGGQVVQARLLGDALLAAQAQDRFWRDGRFRNAYAAGPVPAGAYKLPGWWDEAAGNWVEDAYQVGSSTGVLAWAMLFLLKLARVTGEPAYRQGAARAADWVERTVVAPRGFVGGVFGWEPAPVRIGWISTEHNIDLAVAFAALGRADAARHARDFVASMWQPASHRFAIGLKPDGSLNQSAAADAMLWPLLMPDAAAAWAPALDETWRRQGVPAADPEGIDFNDDRDGIWLEGTAYLALVADRAERSAVAARLLRTLAAQTAPRGLVWASSVPRLTTGLSTGLTTEADFFYYRRPHIGATAWAALAAMKANPFEI